MYTWTYMCVRVHARRELSGRERQSIERNLKFQGVPRRKILSNVNIYISEHFQKVHITYLGHDEVFRELCEADDMFEEFCPSSVIVPARDELQRIVVAK